MLERVYMNRIPGEQRIHIKIPAGEIPDLLEDLYESSSAATWPPTGCG